MRVVLRRTLRVAAATLTLVVLTAAPAMADPAVPTNYRSRVTAVDPDPVGLAIQVTGGDAFLVAAVARGHTLLVPGYFGEPYLRIEADGSVWRNERSPATFINRDRFGTQIPAEADHTAPPSWVRVASGGTYAWHDHRTHWMSPDLPPTIAGDRAQVIFPWEFSVEFDGEPVRVRGELVWFPSVNPFGPLVLGLVAITPLIWWRPHRTRLLAISLAAAGAMALFIATINHAATPIDRPLPVGMMLPMLAIVLAIASTLLRQPIRASAARVLAGSALGIWAVANRAIFTAPVLPSALSPTLERSIVGIVLVAAVAYTAVSAGEALSAGRASSDR